MIVILLHSIPFSLSLSSFLMSENEENIWNGGFKENFRVFSKGDVRLERFCPKFVYCTCAGYVDTFTCCIENENECYTGYAS